MDSTQRKDKDYYRFMDDLLETLRNNALEREDVNNAGKEVKTENVPYSGYFSGHEVGEAYFKLEQDGYIRKNFQNKDVLTIKGHLFVQDGMYSRQRQIESEKRFFRNIMNVFITLGAMATVFLSVLEYKKYLRTIAKTNQENANYFQDIKQIDPPPDSHQLRPSPR